MPRAVTIFKNEGMAVRPFPCAYLVPPSDKKFGWLSLVHLPMHSIFGICTLRNRWATCSLNSKKITANFLPGLLPDQFPDRRNRNPLLFHGIPISDGNCIIFFCLVIYRYTKRCANRIHPAIAFSNGIFFFIKTMKIISAFVHDLPGDLR